MKLNVGRYIYQRIILIAGAIAFVVVLLTAPRYVEYQGGKIRYERIPKQEIDEIVGRIEDLTEDRDVLHARLRVYAIMETNHPSIDLSIAGVRGLAVLGNTVLVYFAAGGEEAKGGEE